MCTRSPTNINLEGIHVDSPVTDGVKPQPNGHGKSTAVKTSSSSMFSFKRPPKQTSAETEKQGNSTTQQMSKRPDSQHYASKDVLSGYPAKKPMKVTSSSVSNASSTGAALPPLSSSYVGTSSISPGRRSKVIQMVSDLECHHSNSTEMTSCETGPVCDDDAEEEYYQDMVTSSAHSLELSETVHVVGVIVFIPASQSSESTTTIVTEEIHFTADLTMSLTPAHLYDIRNRLSWVSETC